MPSDLTVTPQIISLLAKQYLAFGRNNPTDTVAMSSQENLPPHRKIIPTEKNIKNVIVPSGLSEELEKSYLATMEGAEKVGERRRKFWNTLVDVVQKSGYKVGRQRGARVLNLACGKCPESIVLSAFFGGNYFGFPSDDVELVGIDIKAEDIDEARSLAGTSPSNMKFVAGDATSLDTYEETQGKFDVVVIRHQNIANRNNGKEIWTKIFEQALSRLTDDGIIILTSHADEEHKMMIDAFRGLGGEVIVNQSNPFAERLSRPEIAVDKNVAVIKKL